MNADHLPAPTSPDVERDPTVTCPTCDGLTFVVADCRCRYGDGGAVIDEPAAAGRPWADCAVCSGDGSVSGSCWHCRGFGRLRASLVLTVVNEDTGASESACVVPGLVGACQAPDGRWHVPLGPLLADLAARAGCAPASLRPLHFAGLPTTRAVGLPARPPTPGRVPDPADLVISLPPAWRPDLPDGERRVLEARALAGGPPGRWQVFAANATAPAERGAVDLDQRLDRLRTLADQLCLDLVVEARSGRHPDPSWDIRCEPPGASPPANPHGTHRDLPAAVADASPLTILAGLAIRCQTAPAHFLRTPRSAELAGAEPDEAERAEAEPVEPADVDQLERRILRDLLDAPAAQAIWRDGRWRHTRLRVVASTAHLIGLATGQLHRRQEPILVRVWEPPPPSWLADRIEESVCRACRGSGTRNLGLPCFGCAGSGVIRHGAVLTVTDLDGRIVHVNWRPDDATTPATVAGFQPGGQPVLRLPERYRLRTWAATLGRFPAELIDLTTDLPVDPDVIEGVVTVPEVVADPRRAYLARITRGQPAARLLLSAAGRDVPPLSVFATLVTGLGLTMTVSLVAYCDHGEDPTRVSGARWSIAVAPAPAGSTAAGPPAAGQPADGQPAREPPEIVFGPTWPSVDEAIFRSLNHLPVSLIRAVPTDPGRPVPAPRRPPTWVPDPTAELCRLAAAHPNAVVRAVWSGAGWRLHPPD